jgi:S1-C subfamily serine protease
MKRLFVFIVLFWIVAGQAADPIGDLEARQIALFERIAPGVVFISSGEDTIGSGFLVSAAGLILTNSHVVGKAKKVKVVLHDGRSFEGAVVERAKYDIDLALVKIEAKDMPVLDISQEAPIKVGSWAGAVGHGKGAIWTYNTGMISNIYNNKEVAMVFQTQIPLNPGNSGGPVFDREGRVIGLATSAITNSNSINFGIAIDTARNSLDGLLYLSRKLIIRAPEGLPIFVNGVMRGKGPQIVLEVVPGAYEIFIVQQGEMKKVKITYPQQKLVELP